MLYIELYPFCFHSYINKNIIVESAKAVRGTKGVVDRSEIICAAAALATQRSAFQYISTLRNNIIIF